MTMENDISTTALQYFPIFKFSQAIRANGQNVSIHTLKRVTQAQNIKVAKKSKNKNVFA